MRGKLRGMLAFATGTCALAGVAYTFFAASRMRRFADAAAQTQPPQHLPPITILKPLHGDEPCLFENLCSFCEQAYPAYQVVFGTATPDDPAAAIARDVAARYPSLDIRVVTGSNAPSRNPKIANVLGMLPQAAHDLLVIADSDVRVGQQYLRAIARSFDDGETGAVSCLYAGVAARDTLCEMLGAAHVNEEFAPSVLVSEAIEPVRFCLGATMAVRRSVLSLIGGLEALGDAIGDDYELGSRVAAAGYRVAITPYAVTTTVSESTMRALWQREVRWARTIRAARPAGYAGLIFTFPLTFAALTLALASRRAFPLLLLAVATAARFKLHSDARTALHVRSAQPLRILPLREALSVAVWAAGFLSGPLHWRGTGMRIDARGAITEESSA